jgi:hypothetical protein
LDNIYDFFAKPKDPKIYQAVQISLASSDQIREWSHGEIKKPGDRVNILSFLNSILLSDYVVGTDMSSETIVDAEDQLIVEKRKYYNFQKNLCLL